MVSATSTVDEPVVRRVQGTATSRQNVALSRALVVQCSWRAKVLLSDMD